MNTKIATRRMRIGHWANSIEYSERFSPSVLSWKPVIPIFRAISYNEFTAILNALRFVLFYIF